MSPIDLVITVCAVLSPTTCEEQHLHFADGGASLQQWIGEHPKWTAVRWRCEYPHSNDKA